jgi:uncharacterized protein (TIGR02300 family)
MAAKDLGSKFTCFKCSTKFYDMKKPVPACPKCGTDQREAPVVKPSGGRKSAAPKVVEEPAEAPEVEEGEAEEDEDEAEEPEADAE